MKYLLINLVLFALSTCQSTNSVLGLRVVHDEIYQVTCWLYQGSNNSAISCLPETELQPRVR